jgi:hypothetical protein
LAPHYSSGTVSTHEKFESLGLFLPISLGDRRMNAVRILSQRNQSGAKLSLAGILLQSITEDALETILTNPNRLPLKLLEMSTIQLQGFSLGLTKGKTGIGSKAAVMVNVLSGSGPAYVRMGGGDIAHLWTSSSTPRVRKISWVRG